MLSSDYLFEMTDEISEMYEKLNSSVINDMARRISKMDFVSESTKWQMQRSLEAGAVYEDVTKRLAEITEKSENELKKVFKEAGIENLNNNLKKAGMKVGGLVINENMANILVAGLNKTNGILKNLTITTALQTKNKFTDVLDLAYNQIITGNMDYNSAIRNTIKKIASDGVSTFDYKNGYSQKIDSAVRSVVLTGVNQTTGAMTELQADEIGADGYETTAHGGARDSHQIWQGKQFYKDKPIKGYEDFKTITGYGTIIGLKGVSCRHDFFWVFLGKDKLSYTSKELQELNDKVVNYNGKKMTIYDAQKHMRYLERNTRAWKRQSSALNVSGLDNSFEKSKVKEWTDRYKSFTNKTGLRKQNERLVIYDTIPVVKDIDKPNYLIKQVDKSYNIDGEKKYIENINNKITIKEKEILQDTTFNTGTEDSNYDRKNNVVNISKNSNEGEIIHEIGHVIETKLDVYNNIEFLKVLEGKIAEIDIINISASNNYKQSIDILKSDKFISEYQGRVYDFDTDKKERFNDKFEFNYKTLGEYFSEGYRCYYENPKLLRNKDNKLYNYIKELLSNG